MIDSNSSRMLWRFLLFELRQQLCRFRWVAAVMVIAALTWINIDSFLRHRVVVGDAGYSLNVWDGLFCFWSNSYLFFIVLIPTVILLMGDLITGSTVNSSVTLRLRSRRMWLCGKMLAMLSVCLVYVVMVALLSVVVAVSLLPWGSAWSDGFREFTGRIVNTQVMVFTPGAALWLHAGLFFVSCGFWGTVIITAAVNMPGVRYGGMITAISILLISVTTGYMGSGSFWPFFLNFSHGSLYYFDFAGKKWLAVIPAIYMVVLITTMFVVNLVRVNGYDMMQQPVTEN